MTNADRIRGLDDNQLEEWLLWHMDCDRCPIRRRCQEQQAEDAGCLDVLGPWLKEEATDEWD